MSTPNSNVPDEELAKTKATNVFSQDSPTAVSPSAKASRKHHHFAGLAHPHLHRRQFSLNAKENGVNAKEDGGIKRKPRPTRLMSLGSTKEMGQNGVLKYSEDRSGNVEDPQRTPLAFTAPITLASTSQSGHRNQSLSGYQSDRKHSLPGAKPVAPSWHPNAPDGLKVHQPPDALLLPDLPVAGITNSSSQQNLNQTKDDKEGHGGSRRQSVSIQDRIIDLATAAPRLESEKVMKSESVKLQRPSIKVRIITWNQGNSVPKGDLGVLLGRVGEYIAPEAGWDESSDEDDGVGEGSDKPQTNRKNKGMGVPGQEGIPRKDRIPPLPHDDAHPYHVVVIAGQECPWGDGKRISTGVGLAGELGDLSRSKSRAQQIAKEREREARAKEKEKDISSELKEKHPEAPKTPGLIVTNDEDPFNEIYPSSSNPHTASFTPNIMKARGARGWSEMCEDWFCRGPLAQATATKGLAMASTANSNQNEKISSTSFFPYSPEEGLSPTNSRAPTPNLFGSLANGLSTPRSFLSPDSSQTSLALSASNSSLPIATGPIEIPTRRVGLLVPKRMIRTRSKQKLEQEAQIRNLNTALGSSTPSLALDTTQVGEGLLEKAGILEASSPPIQPISPIKQSIDVNVRQFSSQQGLGLALEGLESSTSLTSMTASPSSRPPFSTTQIPSTSSIPTITSTPITPAAKKTQHRLAIRIPGLSGAHQVTVHSDGTPSSLGAYELVCKERCYMMYMAVYVWRGCLDRVRGHSQGHVKCGLLNSRIGNKGAVGISLKLGSTRLLFVNAHLAAHEGKVAERIANVEKIKKELKVDTFLPKDDPRNEADDLTACFDYAYWFGDLNFRVDITRKHADWLMKNHQYDHALCFDQLKKIMREQPEIFQGFKEAPITFPPTFKYDVLKTIKAKKNEEKNAAREGRIPNLDLLTIDSQIYAGDQLTDSMDLSTPIVPPSSSGHTFTDYDDDDNSSISSAIHSSSAGNISEADESSNATSPDSPQDAIVANNTAAAEGLGVHGKVIKARKRIFSLVYSAVGAVANDYRDEPQPYKSAKRFSMEQIGNATIKMSNDRKKDEKRLSSSIDDQVPTQRIITNDSQKAVSLKQSINRSQSSAGSSLQQTNSGGASSEIADVAQIPKKSGVIFADEVKKSESADAEGDGQKDDLPIEQQPYDTSAKQRVPSWCDRVLWKSNIPVESDEGEKTDDLHLNSNRPSRISIAFANALSKLHMKTDFNQSPAIEDVSATLEPYRNSPQTHINSAATVIPPTSITPTQLQEVPPSSPKRKWYGRRRLPSTISNESEQRPKTFQRSTTIIGIEPLSALDPLEGRKMTKRTKSANEIPLASKSADNIHVAFGPSALSQNGYHDSGVEAKNRKRILKSSTSPTLSPRRTSLNIERHLRQRGNDSPVTKEQQTSNNSREDLKSNTNPQTKAKRSSNGDMNIDAKFNFNRSQTEYNESSPRKPSRWNDILLPLFNSQNSVATALANFAFRSGMTKDPNAGFMTSDSPKNAQANLHDPDQILSSQLIGPRKGEIECLLYKSLNDREMRMLEGRSDHRPVIFVSSIGVGVSSPKVPKWQPPQSME